MEVLVTYCNRPGLWPKVVQGLEWNADSISRVVVAESGPPWTLPDQQPEGITQFSLVRKVKKTPEDFAVSGAMNRGMVACRSSWVLNLDDDIVLPRGIVANFEKRCEESTIPLLFGNAWTASLDTSIEDLEKPPRLYNKPVLEKPYHLARGALFAVDRGKFLEMGGWNEKMLDYGYQDYEFTARWMTKYGYNSCALVPLVAWHLEAPDAGKPKPPEDSYNIEAITTAEIALVESLR